MTKLMAQGYELLDPGRYVLEVLEAEAVNEYGPQLKLKPSRGPSNCLRGPGWRIGESTQHASTRSWDGVRRRSSMTGMRWCGYRTRPRSTAPPWHRQSSSSWRTGKSTPPHLLRCTPNSRSWRP